MHGPNQLTSLLQLPEPCLVRILQYCAEDGCRNLFSAARAHSSLHQAAVLALKSYGWLEAVFQPHQQQHHVDSLVECLSKYGQHLASIDLSDSIARSGDLTNEPRKDLLTLRQLPHASLQALTSLRLDKLRLQLQPRDGCEGVLQPSTALKQLQLDFCELLDGGAALMAALAELPGLQGFCFSHIHPADGDENRLFLYPASQLLPSLALLALLPAGLTRLELQRTICEHSSVLRHLQRLKLLQDLRLYLFAWGDDYPPLLATSTLSSLTLLTRLEARALRLDPTVPGAVPGDPAQSADGCLLPRLQHLMLMDCSIVRREGRAALLSHLQRQTCLTYLDVSGTLSLHKSSGADAPAAAYAALTTSSKLEHLDVSYSTLPVGVWEHIFPAGRMLPRLQTLCLQSAWERHRRHTAPEGSRLASCCPRLSSLDVRCLHHDVRLLAPLSKLTRLTELFLHIGEGEAGGLEAVCQLTGLRKLWVDAGYSGDELLLLQLTSLKQLTDLTFFGPFPGSPTPRAPQSPPQPHLGDSVAKDDGDTPVWRQVLHKFLTHSDPAVAEQAAAALAE